MCFESEWSVEFASDRIVKARKPHRCSECRATIEPGQEYHAYSGKYDGEFFDDKICRRCDYDHSRVVERELSEGCYWQEAHCPIGMLVEHLRDSGLGQTDPADVPESFRIGDRPVTSMAGAKSP